jgi:hypothetical protein
MRPINRARENTIWGKILSFTIVVIIEMYLLGACNIIYHGKDVLDAYDN